MAMKVYFISDDIREKEGKNRYTNYEYKCEMEEQVRKRLKRYRKKGYKVETKQDWWTNIQIIEKEV